MARNSGKIWTVAAGGATCVLTILGEQVGNVSTTVFTLLLMTSVLIPAVYFVVGEGERISIAFNVNVVEDGQ